jgi:hypothetical protein
LALIFAVVAPWVLIAWLLAPRAEIIISDPGGPIAARAALIAVESEPAEIRGTCASACTMHLATGCVWPKAVLIFHGPAAPPESFDHWSAAMARHYPPAIADWFMAEGRYGQWRMTGAEAIRLGARACAD